MITFFYIIQTMNKDNNIKQCILIGEPITSDYQSSSIFTKLGQTPVIDYCINWLADNGIKEIFLFYSNTKVQIEEYHKSGQFSARTEIKVFLNYMKPEELKDFGDVMREVQFRNIISGDFLILFADTIANFNLSKAIATHFKRKADLKNVILTTIIRDNSESGKIHITSPETGEILQMDQDKAEKFIINQERVKLKKMNVLFRRDLTHCDIYICTVDVLKSFKENYEYGTMFDYINGMLTSEVYEEKILGHILENSQHSYRINCTKYFFLAYMHFIADHFYPYVLPNKNKTDIKDKEEITFVSKNFNKVISNGVSIARSVYLSNSCYVGEKCKIGADSDIEKSIISSNCQLSNKVSLKNCLILDDCYLVENSTFENCLIQKVNQTLQIKRFTLGPKYEAEIVTEPLFEETPPPEESTFQQELQQVLSDEPRMEILNELNSIRKHHNKSLQEFTKQSIKILKPNGVNGISEMAENWGPIFLKVHDNQSLLIDSLFYTCSNVEPYDKGFHVFLQFFYKFDILKDFAIIAWFEEAAKKQIDSPLLKKCENFVTMLKQQDESDSENGSNSDSQENKSEESK